jgi:penicillin-binding protein activator
MNLLKPFRIFLGLGLALTFLAGCASTPDIKRVDATSQRGLETQGITIRDFQIAAETMVNSLNDSIINTGKLQAPAGKKTMLEVSRIINSTSLHLDPDLLTFPITTALNKTGKIVVKTTDQNAQGAADIKRFFQDEKGMSRLPDYTLSGKIVEQRDQAGNTRQSSYVFQLFLNSTGADQEAPWQEQTIISKQSTRRNLGF